MTSSAVVSLVKVIPLAQFGRLIDIMTGVDYSVGRGVDRSVGRGCC